MPTNNINPKQWGPQSWAFMHYVTLAYPDHPTNEEKENIKIFFNLVGKILPCDSCRQNFFKHMDLHPLTDEVVENQLNLVNWLINIHNEVNKMHGKEILTYDDVINIYMEPKPCNTKLYFIIVIALILIITIIAYKCLKNKNN